MDRRITSKNLILALLIGALGGVVFHILGLPLAWMLGPMAFNMAAALRGVRVAVPLRLRSAMLAVLGVFLGNSFSSENLARAHPFRPYLGDAGGRGGGIEPKRRVGGDQGGHEPQRPPADGGLGPSARRCPNGTAKNGKNSYSIGKGCR
jgi:hypothetical protein